MSNPVVGWAASTFNDALYLEDNRPGAGATLGGVWPFNHFLSEDVMQVGDLVSVTATMWLRTSGEPIIKLGKFVAGAWVDDGAWQPVEVTGSQIDTFWAQTWYRIVDQELLDYGFIDIAALPPHHYNFGPPNDGGQMWGLCWRGPTTLEKVYATLSEGTEHVPDTTNVEVANFYVGGIEPDFTSAITPHVAATIGDAHGGDQIGDSMPAVGPFIESEYFGVGWYQPSQDATEVGMFTTGISQGAMLYGVGPPAALSTVSARAGAGGIVRHKSIVG